MIEVYQAEFRSLGEKYEIESAMTIHEFVVKQAPDYENTPEHRVNAYVNGALVDCEEWRNYRIAPADDVHLVLEPKDGGALVIGAIVAAVVSAAAAILLRPSIPNIGGRDSQQGSSIYEVNAQGNRPKLGDVIPEQAGRHKKYPDILTAPVRRFVNQRSQELYLFFSLGVGEFERDENDLAIGETPVNSLPGVSYQFFEPSGDVSGHPSAENWYNAAEVGASTGAAGLRLRGITQSSGRLDVRGSSNGDVLSFAGGYLPPGWSGDVRLTVRIPQPITVASNQTTLGGDFRHLAAGMQVRIYSVSFAGVYVVRSHSTGAITLETTDGTLVDNLPVGTHTAPIDRDGALYGVVERFQQTTQIRLQRYIDADTIDPGWSEFPTVSDAQNIVVDVSDAEPEALWTGPFLACPKNEQTTVIEWDVFCPNGLCYISDDGSISERSIDVELQWRDGQNGAWSSIVKTVSAATQDQVGWTFRDIIPAASPQTRSRRLTLEDTAVGARDRIEWYGLRCQLQQNTSYPGVSTLAMVISGSDLIASQTENQINIVETRKIPRWNGGAWTAPEPTRDISAWVRYIAHSVGYTDADIDMDELIRLHDIWTARGETFNVVQDEPTTVKEAINTVLRAGMAELTTDGGRITPVRDAPRTTPEHMYSPQNYIEGGGLVVSVSTPRRDDPDGVDVEYFDENSWTTEIVKCRLPGDSGFRAEKVRIDGVTSRLQAYRIGMRERSRQKYARWQYRFATPTDALNSKYLSYCVVAGEVPGFAQSAIIEHVSEESDGVHIESSEPLDWDNGVEHVVSWRRDDGSYSGAWPAERGDDDYHIIAQIPPGEVPVIQRNMEPPHLLFGEGFHVLVRNIEPDGEQVDVTAENYDERVYAYDDATLP